MKLIDEKEVEEVSKSGRWFESIGTPSSDYQLGFTLGSNWTQQKLLPVMVEFAEWCNQSYIMELGSKVWNSTSRLNDLNDYTTEQLLNQFLKTRTK